MTTYLLVLVCVAGTAATIALIAGSIFATLIAISSIKYYTKDEK